MAKVREKKYTIKLKAPIASMQNPIDFDTRIGEEDGILFGCNDKDSALCHNYMLITEYVKSNNNVKRKVFDIDMLEFIALVLQLIYNVSDEKLSNAESFYNYCAEFIKKTHPHYMNILEKTNCSMFNIFSKMAKDLADEILLILKQ